MRRPDYANPLWWSLYPGEPSYAAGVIGASDDAVSKPADLFYIHPTTTTTPAWNQIDQDVSISSWTDRSAVIRHLDPFAGICRLFAPRYRQASPRAVRNPGADADAAWNLAYEDVRDAFAYFVRHAQNGRPFILVGHSQGSLHASRLLAEVIEASGLQEKLVAAYLVGIGVSESLFDTYYRSITPCAYPEQNGCVISWNSFLRDADITSFLTRTRLRDERRSLAGPVGLPLCTNPLSYAATRPVVEPAENPGSLTGDPGVVPLPALVPGLVGAACEGGVLRVDPPPAAGLGLDPLPGGNMHMHDIALFHASLRNDARRRVGIALRVT